MNERRKGSQDKIGVGGPLETSDRDVVSAKSIRNYAMRPLAIIVTSGNK